MSTGTLGLNDLVFELTGIDLSTTTKEDLHKEAMDRSTSAVIFTPDVQEVNLFPEDIIII